MLDLLEAYGFFGLQHGSAVLLGLLRSKILAATLGPFGVGIFSQANTFFTLLQGFYILGLGGSLTKMVAEACAREDYPGLNQTILTVMLAYSGVGLIFVALCTLFAQPLAQFAFSSSVYRGYIILVGLTAFAWLHYQELLIVFRGLMQWREASLVAILGNAINVLVMLGCVLLWGVWGAVLSLLISQVVSFLLAFGLLVRSTARRYPIRFWKAKPQWSILRSLWDFAAPLTVMNLLGTLLNLIIRSQIIRQLGVEANGLYQAAYSVSFAYMGFVNTAVWGYGIPKLSALKENIGEVVRIQNNSLRLGWLTLVPFTVALLAGREIWIPLLFSPAFLSVAPLFIWQLMGDVLFFMRMNILISMVPLEKMRNYFFEGVAQWLGWTGFSMLFLERWGIAAVLFGYFAVNLLFLVFDLTLQSRVIAFRLSPENRRMFLKGIPLVVLGYLLAQWIPFSFWRLALCSAVVLALLVWLPSAQEKRSGAAYLRRLLAKLLAPFFKGPRLSEGENPKEAQHNG
ncbi:MAG: oligosaccharide flippase family protein [Anaerolineales bacterium]|nr:oligosaccharide flippase family protein [Anaerolineales bacterium]MCS7248301.1 oligosaccharide flippase family protein [Anaerolineales bacterium]MDW8162115.1 oligosaccharide flippase family protein [Anaerolineales bacterium]MDW8447619.1 oligosaccharide flippase family protein [Anaerolineales bacterium]